MTEWTKRNEIQQFVLELYCSQYAPTAEGRRHCFVLSPVVPFDLLLPPMSVRGAHPNAALWSCRRASVVLRTTALPWSTDMGTSSDCISAKQYCIGDGKGVSNKRRVAALHTVISLCCLSLLLKSSSHYSNECYGSTQLGYGQDVASTNSSTSLVTESVRLILVPDADEDVAPSTCPDNLETSVGR